MDMKQHTESHALAVQRSSCSAIIRSCSAIIRSGQVDMKQHTESHALAVLALRPAPLHLAWLGFPGGAGGGLCDLLVGDPVARPPKQDKAA